MNVSKSSIRGLAGGVAAALAVTVLPAGSAYADRDVVCADAPANSFSDVHSGSTHAGNIDCVAAHGITVGAGGGNYDPSGTVSRGQMASFLVNFVEVATDEAPTTPVAAVPFSDIEGTTHASNIRIAAALGITSGRTATTYAPAGRVTREQMATFVAQALRAADADLDATAADRFTDDDASVHEANINALAAAGVVTGIGGDRYDPRGHVTRAQMATFLANAAGLLSDQGLWKAPALQVGRPQVILVTPGGGALDEIDVRWNRSVTLTSDGAFEVANEADTAIVARASDVSERSDDVLSVALDDALVVDEMYWLRVTESVVTDEDGRVNDEHRIAFSLSAVDVEGEDAEGDDTALVAPAIASVITNPGEDRLEVTFDQPVVCPSSSASAWSFTNNSIIEDGTHATGSPDSVEQPGGSSTRCHLLYSTDGVEAGDFGTMSFTRPDADAERVRSSDDVALETVTGIRVTDGLAPTFDGIVAHAGSRIVGLSFSEPIACATVSASEFRVTVGGAPMGVVDYACSEHATDFFGIMLDVAPIAGEQVTVTVSEGTSLSDQSLDNRLAATTQSVTAL